MTSDYLKAVIELGEDCDIDCQRRGSQLTLIGLLMGIAYFIIALNSVFMFIGAFRFGFRVFSIYFTMFACAVQLLMIITSSIFLFTKYNALCSKSLTNTFEGYRWTMADDFQTVIGLWASSFVTMFCVCGCGLQSAYSRPYQYQQSIPINKF